MPDRTRRAGADRGRLLTGPAPNGGPDPNGGPEPSSSPAPSRSPDAGSAPKPDSAPKPAGAPQPGRRPQERPGPPRPARPRSIDDGDGWVQCRCGQRHWGRYGAAGLLLADGEGQVVLQHRAPWSHQGDTWGIPGGARNRTETAVHAAVREAEEEAGLGVPVDPHATYVLEHPDWTYTTVLAHVPTGTPVAATDAESVQVRWHPATQVTDLPLLGAFASAWPLLHQMLHTRPVLVVDAANVVGSRPDGWWKDRAGATARLTERLAALAGQGVGAAHLDLPGHTWWPAVVLVTEGRAREAPDVPGVQVLRAAGSGDDEVARAVRTARAGHLVAHPAESVSVQVTVVTADRELQDRVRRTGARVASPGRLWRLLDDLPT